MESLNRINKKMLGASIITTVSSFLLGGTLFFRNIDSCSQSSPETSKGACLNAVLFNGLVGGATTIGIEVGLALGERSVRRSEY